jgi:hypothetical protein
MPERPRTYYDFTLSLCAPCRYRIEPATAASA